MSPQAPSNLDTLSVSIIVTNYNYGHYLASCLDSVRAQTVAPDEIIVVNDGSTDGSAEILKDFDDVTVISQPNGGQAAAFNAGFAASRGEIVIFLDADDKLRPAAVEVIRRLWTSEVSALSFSLAMIDGQGRGIGQYQMDLPDTDLLPRLLGHLTIPFMPTSGNAFRRSAIDWAFPLPIERWRISADALLIRAAVLAAPIRHIRQTLGEYRVHGQNNYFRSGASAPWKANRGLRDVSEAGLDLIGLADRGDRALSRRDRAKLLTAAVRTRLKAESLRPDPTGLAQFHSLVLQQCKFRETPRLYLTLWMSLLALRRSSRLRNWAIDPRQCPRVLPGILKALRGKALSAELADLVPPRAPYGNRLSPDAAAPDDPIDWLSSPEWQRDHGTGGTDLCEATGRFVLRRSWAGPAKLTLGAVPRPGPTVCLAAFQSGLPLGAFELESAGDLVFTLPEAKTAPPEPDVIELRVTDVALGRFGALSRLWRKAHRVQIRSLRVEPLPPEPENALVGVMSQSPFGRLGDVVQSANGAVLQGEKLIGSGEILSLAPPPLKPPFCLALRLAETQAEGHMTLTTGGAIVFSGDVSSGSNCLVEMPERLTLLQGPVALEFGFRPTDFLEEPVVAIRDLGWLPHGAEGRYGLPVLSPGAWAGPRTGRPLEAFLGAGWQLLDSGAAAMLGPSAGLILSQGAVVAGSVLRLDLEPMDPLVAHSNLIVLVNVNGVQRAAVQLVEQAIVYVEMDGILSGPKHKVEIDIFAAMRPDDGEVALDHGGVRLNGLGLFALTARPVPANSDYPSQRADTALARLLLDLRRALDRGVSQSQFERLRGDLSEALLRSSPAAVTSTMSAAHRYDLCGLPADLPPLEDGIPALCPSDWLRPMALRVLSGPACRSMPEISLSELPEVTPDFAAVIGAYLVADPPPGATRDDLLAFQSYLVRMLEQARVVLAQSPEDSPHLRLATAMVTGFRARQLLFSDLPLRPHVEAFGKALEAMLLRQGYDLFTPQPRPEAVRRGKQRIGVLLHNTEPSPETWIWRKLLKSLPKDRIEVTLFLTEQNDPPKSGFEGARVIGLAGQSLAATVTAVRREQMNVLLLGGVFYGHCFMTELCAHRLAPRQIALSAVFPTTTGLASVTEFLLGKTVAPKKAVDDYCERVVWTPGTGQAFEIPLAVPADAEKRAVTRRRIGIGAEDVMFVSGAMQDKIGAEVLAVWTRILAQAPKAALVLYPFAANWQQNFDQPAFADRLAAACTASGVDPRRIRVLPPIPNFEVKQVLRAADVYLDSFPYSGATTTVETLQCDLPVVAMRGHTQRGHQAAGWLAAFGLRDLVATSHRAYVRIAVDLAGNADRRAEVKRQIEADRGQAMAQAEFAEWFKIHLLPKVPDETEAPRYLFHHMPKTGGTSLKKVFGRWFDLVEDYRAPWAYIMPPKLDLDTMGPGHMLCGHFAADTAPLNERYPQTCDPVKWRRIGFVRNPLERAISLHAFEKKLRPSYDQTYAPIPLGEYLRENRSTFLSHFECNETNWQAALDRYWFIGTLERLPECLDYLAAQLGKSVPPALPHENATRKDEEVSKEDIAAFMQNNAIEFEIYDEIAKRLDALLGQHARN